MEPVTTTVLAVSAWELIGKPFTEKTRDYYSEKVLDYVPKLWDKFTSFKDDDKKAIEAVIIDMPNEVRKDEAKFKEYIVENLIINNQQRVIHTKTNFEHYHNNNGITNFN